MRKYAIIAFVLVLTVSLMAGCRRNQNNETTAPSESNAASTEATRDTQMPSTGSSNRETEDNGIMDDMITEGSEIIDDILPDDTGSSTGADDSGRIRQHGMPRY